MPKSKLPVYGRLMSFVDRGPGCWGWNGYVDRQGYGRLMIPGGPTRAHRLSYKFHCGEIPQGKYVLHRCDNRQCTNPEHLYVGDHAQNMVDKKERGRCYTGGPPKGEEHKLSKFTNADIALIRASALSNQALAQKYDASHSTIGMIKRRETWRHLP